MIYLQKCSLHIKSKLKTASFVPSDEILEEDTEDLKRKGEIRVMAIVYSTDPSKLKKKLAYKNQDA